MLLRSFRHSSLRISSFLNVSSTQGRWQKGKGGYRSYSNNGENRGFYQNKSNKKWFIAGASALIIGGMTMSSVSVFAEEPRVDYDKVRKEVAALIDEDENRGPTFIRLAWHSSGTYSIHHKDGGSDGGTIRFKPESAYAANAGLSTVTALLEKVKLSNPGISYADLYILAGIVAIEKMGGPKITFNPGRTDEPNGVKCTPNGRLPDADKGSKEATIQHIREVFYRQGFNDREIVALLGAHSMGHCHADRSGYVGPWTKAPTMFSNEYFRELLTNTWTLKKWKGPEQYEDPSGELMMLPSDMALIWDPKFKEYVELYAKDEELWFKDFAKAFQKLTENGVKNLKKKSSWFGF